ncbi:hypothetical protein XTPLMG730_2646 [Xanthomonas translucens pv. phlei]|uniref:TonB-dependent receptor n=1 Tax=Xanthomonas graminis pv. phlei TaxID=487906 RepID=A0A0K2ZW97_9XANT|nr:hypothetical protein XTPLMG730_2646 [Xanthomonas translucens pv. phlei]
MNFPKSFRAPRRTTLALLLSAMVAHAQAASDASAPVADAGAQVSTLDQVQVVGQVTTYAKTSVSKEMLDRQFAMGSVNDALNELPG